MLLKSLYLKNYRNIKEIFFVPEKGINVIYGENAQGKTNLLEAIYYTGFLKSFRNSKLRDIIKWNENTGTIDAKVSSGEVLNSLKIELSKSSKSIFVNNKKLKRTIDYYGKFVVIFFGPDDLKIVQGNPEIRRKFIDRIIFLIDKKYLMYLKRYKKIVEERNALLKNSDSYNEMFEVYDNELQKISEVIVKKRKDVAKLLNKYLVMIFDFLKLKNFASVRYDPSLNSPYFFKKNFVSDLKRGYTVKGPHSDDMKIFMNNGKEFKNFASQGQKKLLSLILKMCEYEIIKDYYRFNPVLLLDDISSELDDEKRKTVFEFVRKRLGQIFITTTSKNIVNLGDKITFFMVKNGEITKDE